MDISSHNKQQLHVAVIIYTQDDKVVLDFQADQLLRGTNDCGLFALTYAGSLCAGEDLTVVSYHRSGNFCQEIFMFYFHHLTKCQNFCSV